MSRFEKFPVEGLHEQCSKVIPSFSNRMDRDPSSNLQIPRQQTCHELPRCRWFRADPSHEDVPKPFDEAVDRAFPRVILGVFLHGWPPQPRKAVDAASLIFLPKSRDHYLGRSSTGLQPINRSRLVYE